MAIDTEVPIVPHSARLDAPCIPVSVPKSIQPNSHIHTQPSGIIDNARFNSMHMGTHTESAAGVKTVSPFHALQSHDGVITLELCAGSAGVTSALCNRGFTGIGVDQARNPHRPKAACAKIDLASAQGQQIILEFIAFSVVFFSWLGPPCGTASRAREIPLTWQQRQQGAPTPRPLRSAAFPRGLPNLRGLDKERVELATSIYDFCAAYIQRCLLKGLYFAIENPRGSWLWTIAFYAALLLNPVIFVIDLQACSQGSDRPKWTRVVTNMPELVKLRTICPGISPTHKHAAWGVAIVSGQWKFRTAEEAVYPALFCKNVADAVCEAAVRHGHDNFAIEYQPELHDAPLNKRVKLAAGEQPRGARVPPLVPEFLSIEKRAVTKEVYETITVGAVLKAGVEAKVLRKVDGGGIFEVVMGVYHTPSQFIQAASEVSHPFDSICTVDDQTRRNVFSILSEGKIATARHRVNGLKKLSAMLKVNASSDAKAVSDLEPAMSKVLDGKKLITLRELLTEFKYADKRIVDDILEGFEHVGMPLPSGIFRKDGQLPSMTPESLRQSSRWVTPTILGKVVSSGNKELDDSVWAETLEETKQGWLLGPYDPADVDRLYPQGWCACRRFGIMQGSKLRCIDDLSEPGTNSAYGSREKLDLMSLDAIAAVVRLIHTAISEDRTLEVKLSDGTALRGNLHPTWDLAEARTWFGRCLDLSKAYRQIATNRKGRWAAIVSVFEPESGRVKCFVATAMLFGGTAAVYAFNRASRALWFLGTHLLRLVWTNFYDDYPSLEPASTAAMARSITERFLKMLGWKIAEGGKSLSFAPSFSALGATVNLAKMPLGQVFFENKAERLSAIAEEIDQVRKDNHLSPPRAASLKGKLQYAESHVYGRIATNCLRAISAVACRKVCGYPVSRVTMSALDWLMLRLRVAGPRPVLADKNLATILVFTDAASEADSNTCGGIFIDSSTGTREYFSADIGPLLIKEWRSSGQIQIIGQAELYPVWIARRIWDARLRGRRVIFFIDNNGAKDSIIRGSSDSESADWLVRAILTLECDQHSCSWYARVPTASNPADKPSRLDISELESDPSYRRINVSQPNSFSGGVARFV